MAPIRRLPTKSGDTPLHAAAGIGWAANWSVNAPVPLVDAVKYCVELGNDVNAADNRGYTALHGAAYLGDNDMVNYLVSKGAKIDVEEQGRGFGGRYGERSDALRPAASGDRGAAREAGVAEFAQLPVGPMRGRGARERLRSSADRRRSRRIRTLWRKSRCCSGSREWNIKSTSRAAGAGFRAARTDVCRVRVKNIIGRE